MTWSPKDHPLSAVFIAGVTSLALGYVSGFRVGKRYGDTSNDSGLACESLQCLVKSVFGVSAKTLIENRTEGLGVSYQSTKDVSLRRQTLVDLEKAFRISKHDLEVIVDSLMQEIERGLVYSLNDTPPPTGSREAEILSSLRPSSLPMLPSYVDGLPTGKESGTYLAVDFGGTHIRIIKVMMDVLPINISTPSLPRGLGKSKNTSKYRLIHTKTIIPDALKTGSGVVLFEFVAQCVADFLRQYPIGSETDPTTGKDQVQPAIFKLGFTFSFPVKQTALNEGTIVMWNKDFTCNDVLGQDPVKLLQTALDRKGLQHIIVSALVNDTVGTLVAHSFEDVQTRIGLILGTGANGAYVERTDRIMKIPNSAKSKARPNMLMNTEFGAFNPDRDRKSTDKKILPRTEYDVRADTLSLAPGAQIFEKMISGHYLGEIVRIVLMELIEKKRLFVDALTRKGKGVSADNLSKRHSFSTSYMSRIERDHSSQLADTKAVFEDIFGINEMSYGDLQLIKFVCELVGIRSARLAAAVVAAILAHIGKGKLLCHTNRSLSPSSSSTSLPIGPVTSSSFEEESESSDNVVVAIDGSLFEHYPHYGNRMMDALRELFGTQADNVQLCLARDGSGLGAALIAAISGNSDSSTL